MGSLLDIFLRRKKRNTKIKLNKIPILKWYSES